MLRNVLRFRDPPFERVVQLYCRGPRFIVAATHFTRDGIHVEQPAPVVLEVARPVELGMAFRTAFDACSRREVDLSAWKKSDWPAFRASGLRSIKAFEREYTAMQCVGLNPSNAVVRASAQCPDDPELELSIAFNPLLDPGQVGERLLRLARRAMADGRGDDGDPCTIVFRTKEEYDAWKGGQG